MQLGLFSEDRNDRNVCSERTSLVVITWNLQRANRERIQMQLDWIKTKTPDVLCLTEIPAEHSDNSIEKELGLLGYSVTNSNVPARKAGALIAAKAKIIRIATPPMFEEPWRITSCRLDSLISNLIIVSLYAPTIGRFRDNSQMRAHFHESLRIYLTQLRKDWYDYDFLLCGDLNVHPASQRPWIQGALRSDTELLEALQRIGFYSAHTRSLKDWPFTWTGLGERFTFDYILCTKEFFSRCKAFYCLEEDRALALSDHAPLMATFQIA